jgi:hypothetical protein
MTVTVTALFAVAPAFNASVVGEATSWFDDLSQ